MTTVAAMVIPVAGYAWLTDNGTRVPTSVNLVALATGVVAAGGVFRWTGPRQHERIISWQWPSVHVTLRAASPGIASYFVTETSNGATLLASTDLQRGEAASSVSFEFIWKLDVAEERVETEASGAAAYALVHEAA